MTYEFHAVDSPFGFLCSEYSHRIMNRNQLCIAPP